MWHTRNGANANRQIWNRMRSQRRMDLLELEIFKIRIELDIMHEILGNVINTQQASTSQSMDSGKWYPRKLPPQNT